MSLKFQLKMNHGVKTLTSNQLLNQYGEIMGYEPMGLTQDGASGIYRTPEGMQTIPFHEALSQRGIEIQEFEPTNSIQAENLGKYRMALESISDPGVKQAYLKDVATKEYGIENPQIVNKGSQAFLWAPKQGAWIALTDSPGLDRGDILAGAASLGRGALSIAGGALGGLAGTAAGIPAGPAAIATGIGGAALGSGIGSAVADQGQAAIMAALDPNFRDAYGSVSNYAQKEGGNIGRNALVSGATGGLLKGVGQFLPGLAAARPSNVMQGAGKMAEGAGKMTSSVGRGLDTTLGRVGLQAGLDPTGISGVGAMGGFAKDMAAPIGQGIAKTGQFVRDAFHGMKGTVGPMRPIAGETFEQTAQNMPGLGSFVRGVEGFGGGLEKMGRAAENVIGSGVRGVGATLQGTGRMAQIAGKGARYLEGPATQAGARSFANQQPANWQNQGSMQQAPYLQTGLDPASSFQVMNQPSSLMDAIAARGGFNVL
jgi:hypothetical protein